MNEVLIWLLTFVAGLLLGAFFFGGLWWTTRKAVVSKSPSLWFFGSMIIRLGVTLIALYYISDHHWERMLICLIGFIAARTIILRVTKNMKINNIDNKGGET